MGLLGMGRFMSRTNRTIPGHVPDMSAPGFRTERRDRHGHIPLGMSCRVRLFEPPTNPKTSCGLREGSKIFDPSALMADVPVRGTGRVVGALPDTRPGTGPTFGQRSCH
jgi:hypothetical protein